LSQGAVSSFNSTSDGCVLSLLFDDFRAPLATKSKAAVPLRRFTLASSAAAVGQPMTFDIRGFTANAAGSKIRLKVGEQQLQLEPKDGNFGMRTQAPAIAADTPVEILLDVPHSDTAAPVDVQVTIDSIDISMGGCSSGEKRG
jgi:hypothetical protein